MPSKDKNGSATLCIVLGVIVIVALVLFMTRKPKAPPAEGYGAKKPVKENFTALAAGANDNTGMLLDDAYDLLPGADSEVPAHHFADMVQERSSAPSDTVKQPRLPTDSVRPMERLHRVQGKALMPRVSTHVTPYNVDVANPTSHKYMVNTPRVTTALRSRYRDSSFSTYLRGDIPIRYNPNVALIERSHIGRDAQVLDGFFSDGYRALYDKYSGQSFKNLVQKVAGAGQAGGYGGASGGTVLDHM